MATLVLFISFVVLVAVIAWLGRRPRFALRIVAVQLIDPQGNSMTPTIRPDGTVEVPLNKRLRVWFAAKLNGVPIDITETMRTDVVPAEPVHPIYDGAYVDGSNGMILQPLAEGEAMVTISDARRGVPASTSFRVAVVSAVVEPPPPGDTFVIDGVVFELVPLA